MRAYISVTLIIFGYQAYGQSIKGVVVDFQNRDSLYKVHVFNKTRDIGQVTDFNGSFEITADLYDSLIFSYIGYKSRYLTVLDSSFYNIQIVGLLRDTILLPEILITSSKFQLMEKEPLMRMQIPGIELPENVKTYKPGDIEIGNDLWKDPTWIPMFGANFTYHGPFSYYSKSNRDLRRLEKAEKYYESVKMIIEASNEIRGQITSVCSIDSEAFQHLLNNFINEYREKLNHLEKSEIIALLFHYFHSHKP